MHPVTLPAGGLADLRQAVEAAASEAVQALREAGRRLAGNAEAAISERRGRALPDLSTAEFWEELRRYFQDAGWGELEHRDATGGVGGLVARNWAEADPSEARGAPGCHISTGLLAELLSRAANRPVAVLEVTCRSRGDAHCQFLFGSPGNLLLIHRKLANGGSLEDALSALS